jgi:hypothetical protein
VRRISNLIPAGAVCIAGLSTALPASAQDDNPFATPRAGAPVDLTGYWVSIVTEDWIERMSPDSPPTGTGFRDRIEREEVAVTNPGEPCRAYGAAGSLRVPGRLHIAWLDDFTLEIELDAGSQRRRLHFDPDLPAPTQKSLQGFSRAKWDLGNAGASLLESGSGVPALPVWGSLDVVTSQMSGGFLLSSRTSYTDEAVLTEHFTFHSDFGAEYFTVTAVVEDLGSSNITSSTFRKERNGSKFQPTGCEIIR